MRAPRTRSFLPCIVTLASCASTEPPNATGESAASERRPVVLDLSAPSVGVSWTRLAENWSGDAVLVWTAWTGPTKRGPQQLLVATRRAGSGWTQPELLDEPSVTVAVPSVAVDASGNAVVVWERSPGVWARTHVKSAGRWTDSVQLSSHADGTAGPEVAVDGSGNAVAVWAEGHALATSRRDAGSGRWMSLSPLLTELLPNEPGLGMDASGNAYVAYLQRGNPSAYRIARLGAGDGAWTVESGGAPSSAPNESAPRVAVAATGDALVVWAHDYLRDSGPVVRGSYRSRATGAWSLLEDLSEPGAPWGTVLAPNDPSPRAAFDASGRATVVWSQITAEPAADRDHPMAAASRKIGFASLDASGRAVRHGVIDDPSLAGSSRTMAPARSPALAVSPDGDAAIAWKLGAANGKDLLYAATRAGADGAWKLTTLSRDVPMTSWSAGMVDRTATIVWGAADGASGHDVVHASELEVR